MEFKKVNYDELQAKQKEVYNYAKMAYILAQYGYESHRFVNDVGGADFLSVSLDGDVHKIQQKGRLTLSKKYYGKSITVAFFQDDKLYLCDHDKIVDNLPESTKQTKSWQEAEYHWKEVPKSVLEVSSQHITIL